MLNLHKLPGTAACVVGAMLLAACGAEDSVPAGDLPPSGVGAPSAAERARVTGLGEQAASALMASLGAQLMAAMEAGGPVEAVAVCRNVALPLTDGAASGFEGVSLRRTTSKPRNPANAPDERDLAVLATMEAAATGDDEVPGVMIEWDDTVAHFYAPVFVQQVCLNCHGDPGGFSEPLAEKLRELYPDDQATGYALGDFRGVIRVDIDRQP